MKAKFNFIPKPIKAFLRKTSFFKKQAIAKKQVLPLDEIDSILNQAPPLLLENTVKSKPKVGIVITQESGFFVDYGNPKASWRRYKRFCDNNDIPYEYYDIKRSDWLQEADKYDIIICHTPSTPAYQEMIESKIYTLEKILGKTCFPSFHELWQYEDKIRSHYLYKKLKLPAIPTYVTHSKEEALIFANNLAYPFIAKTSIGASSSGVKKIDSKKEAFHLINKIFSYSGVKSQFPYKNQKDYLYIQEFIDDATFDLRIMLVGNMAFGYYRYPKKGDYRASGSGITIKKDIPHEALKLAADIRDKLQSRQMGVDLLYSEKKKQYMIIETSLFNQIDTPVQLEIDGVPGYYDISDRDNIVFKEGKFWMQELLIRDIVKQWMNIIA